MLFAVLGLFSVSASAKNIPPDPLESVQWEVMYQAFFKDKPVVFDERVKVLMPDSAENSLEVPVFADVSAIQDVKQILVFADLNPIPKIVEYFPGKKAKPTLGFRFKVQQATPVRVAALSNGTWHVGGKWVDAAGGGCTLPSIASGEQAWATRLGEMHGQAMTSKDSQRVRFSVLHPMDTGLAPGIPAFFINQVSINNADNEEIARIKPYEPISENPVFTIDIINRDTIRVDGRDNNGNRFAATLPVQTADKQQ